MALEVTLGPATAEWRRRLGPVAWCALEAIAEHAAFSPNDDCAEVNVRAVAVELGIAPNTASRALRRLVDAGLVEPRQSRNRRGRFGVGTYRVTIPSDVLRVSVQVAEHRRPSSRPSKSRRPRQLAPVEQLVLVPSG
jgi:DNA-binding transcriptional ArsR family regulator